MILTIIMVMVMVIKKKKKKKTMTSCWSAGSSLGWDLNFRALVCGIFWSSSQGVFSRHTGFLPSLIVNGSAKKKIKLK